MPEFVIDINFNINNDALTEAEEELQSLKDSAEDTGEGVDSANTSMDEFNNKTEEANKNMQETTDSAMGLGDALVGVGAAVGLDSMIATGDNINTSWERLSLTFEGTGTSMDSLKGKASELSADTGRSGSQIREYFNQMGLAGVTNTELLSSSFTALSGKSFQTGNSIESMTQRMSMMSMSGNASARMLKNLGINTSDLADAMGVTEDQAADTFKSLSQEERLQALTTAMGDGAQANEMYKNSYAGLKAQAETSMAALAGSIGQSILPIVIPAMQGAKGAVDALTSTFKGLPAPVQSVIGVIGGGVMGVTALGTAFGILGKVGSSVVGGLKSLKSGFDAVRGAMSTARIMTEALRNAESVSEGVRAALAIATGAETTAEGANAAAKAAATGPTAGLAIAENSLLLPILLVVGAIVALVAILYYLYNNNEMVRNGVNLLIQKFQEFIGNLINTASQVVSFVSQVVGLFLNWNSQSQAVVNQLISNIVNAFTSLPSQISNAVSGITSILTKPFTDAWNTISGTVDNITGALNNLNPASWFGAEYEGFNSIGYEGFDSLNSAIGNSTTSNNSNVTNNFNINGIIEEEASQYIVDSVNGYIKKQNLVRGV